MAGSDHLRVRGERHGRVCVLSVSGELDVLTAGGFTERAARSVDGPVERLVLDLSGLTFLDCSGARALAAVVRALPRECPVIVRSVQPAVRRLLALLGLDLDARRGQPRTGSDMIALPWLLSR